MMVPTSTGGRSLEEHRFAALVASVAEAGRRAFSRAPAR